MPSSLLRAAVVAGLAAAATAYQADDVCDVNVKLQYSAPVNLAALGEQVFTITDQDATVSFILDPGTFTIGVEGELCDGASGPEFNSPDGIAFEGSSAAQTLVDGGADLAITFAVFDKQTFGSNLDQSLDYDPIIFSLSVSPAHIEDGENTTITVGAIDPVEGQEPVKYLMTLPDASTQPISGIFNPAIDSVGDGTGATQELCTAGPDFNTCSVDYTAGATDNGNYRFRMEVQDAAGNFDMVQAYIAVDATQMVTVGVLNYHGPSIEAISSLVPSDGKVPFSGTATFSVPVKDVDLINPAMTGPDQDAVQLEIVSAVSRHDLVEAGIPGQKTIRCHADDLTIVSSDTPTDSDTTTFQMQWDPWANILSGESAADYGETWCEFVLRGKDSQDLESQQVEFLLGAIGTSNSGGAFNQLPMISQVFVSDYNPEITDTLSITVSYYDPDSQVDLQATPVDAGGGAYISSDGPQIQAPASCPSTSWCSATFTFTVDGTSGPYDIELVATDQTPTDSGATLTAQKTLSFNVPGSTRKRRSPLAGNGVGSVNVAVDGNVATVSSQGLATGTKSTAGAGAGSAGGSAAGSTASSTGMIVGAAVGSVAVVALLAVGVVARTRRSRIREPADDRRQSLTLPNNAYEEGIDL